jgi:hypothetical protein
MGIFFTYCNWSSQGLTYQVQKQSTLGEDMDFYFGAPKWDPKKPGFLKKLVPMTEPTATEVELTDVHDQTVIHIKGGMYRNATLNGTYLLSKSVKLPLADEGKRRVFLYCRWFGHRLIGDKGISALVDLSVSKVQKEYSGKVVTNIAKRAVVTK